MNLFEDGRGLVDILLGNLQALFAGGCQVDGQTACQLFNDGCGGNVQFAVEDADRQCARVQPILVIVEAERNSRTAFEPLRRYKLSEAATWAQPSYSGNRVFVKDLSTLSLWTLN